MRSHVQLRPGALVQIRGERWRVRRTLDAFDGAVVDVSGCDRNNAGARTAFVVAAEEIGVIRECHDLRLVRASQWRRIARRELADALPGPDALRAAASAHLSILPFQLEPALAVARGDGHRLLIADAVGLGKTIQAGLIVAELLHRRDEARALIVTPASLREQWAGELRTRFGLRAASLDAQEASRAAVLTSDGTNPWALHPVVVTSIDYVKRPEVLAALEPLIWDAVVLDEAHQLCGTSERATAATRLARRARVVVALTATPHSGDDAAFARLCAVGRLGRSPLLAFRRTRADVGLARPRRTTWLKVRLSTAERLLHEQLLEYARLVWRGPAGRRSAHLALIVLVKRACSSPASLLRSLERRHALLRAGTRDEPGGVQADLPFVDARDSDEEPHAILGAAGFADTDVEAEVVSRLSPLARAAAIDERKLAALKRLLRRLDEPVLVFTEYRDTLEHLRAHLARSAGPDACPPVVVHGGLTSAERRDALGHFTAGDARLLLATDAASEGLNLHQRCRYVVHMELPWSPVRLEQRTGRVDRIGQPRRVHALHLVAGRTEEEAPVARLLRRMTRADSALGRARPHDGEDAITSAVMHQEDAEVVPDARARPHDDDLFTPDLRQTAEVEAARLQRSRRLVSGARQCGERRPVATRIRHVRRRGCTWAVRVALTAADDRPLCTLMVGVGMPPADPVDAAGLRDLLFEQLRTVLPRVGIDAATPMRDAVRAIARRAEAARVRELDILASLRGSRARLAPRQGGLFDRRAERLATAQAAVLDAALRQCEGRLIRLAAEERPVVSGCHLAFAVLLG